MKIEEMQPSITDNILDIMLVNNQQNKLKGFKVHSISLQQMRYRN